MFYKMTLLPLSRSSRRDICYNEKCNFKSYVDIFIYIRFPCQNWTKYKVFSWKIFPIFGKKSSIKQEPYVKIKKEEEEEEEDEEEERRRKTNCYTWKYTQKIEIIRAMLFSRMACSSIYSKKWQNTTKFSS